MSTTGFTASPEVASALEGTTPAFPSLMDCPENPTEPALRVAPFAGLRSGIIGFNVAAAYFREQSGAGPKRAPAPTS